MTRPQTPSTTSFKFGAMLGFIALICIGWSLFWYMTKDALLTEVQHWNGTQNTIGPQQQVGMSWTNPTVSGFPFQLRLNVENFKLAIIEQKETATETNSADTSWGTCTAPKIGIVVRPWNFRHAIGAWTDTLACNMQDNRDATSQYTLESHSGRFSLVTDAKYQNIRASIDMADVQVGVAQEKVFSPKASLHITQFIEAPSKDTLSKGLGLAITATDISSSTLTALNIPNIQAFKFIGSATSSASTARPQNALSITITPANAAYTIQEFSAKLGTSKLDFTADFSTSAGKSNGKAQATITNFKKLSQNLSKTPEIERQLSGLFALVAIFFSSHDSNTTTIPLKIQDSTVSTSGIKLFTLPDIP